MPFQPCQRTLPSLWWVKIYTDRVTPTDKEDSLSTSRFDSIPGNPLKARIVGERTGAPLPLDPSMPKHARIPKEVRQVMRKLLTLLSAIAVVFALTVPAFGQETTPAPKEEPAKVEKKDEQKKEEMKKQEMKKQETKKEESKEGEKAAEQKKEEPPK
jgi:hypothetical protein